jgi:hypothetical protein
MTVRCRRSAEAVGGGETAASTAPQFAQTFASAGLPWPHNEHAVGSEAPHWLQNLLLSAILALQLGQSIPHLASISIELGPGDPIDRVASSTGDDGHRESAPVTGSRRKLDQIGGTTLRCFGEVSMTVSWIS